MERLTERLRTGEVLMASDYEEKYTEQEWICVLQDRLADYEDTGLTPESVEALKLSMMGKAISEVTEFNGLPIDRLRELAEADKDCRLVVLPCKVGDTVWIIGSVRRLYSEKVRTFFCGDPNSAQRDAIVPSINLARPYSSPARRQRKHWRR